MTNRLRLTTTAITAVYAVLILVTPLNAQNHDTLLNMSYGIARDLYAGISAAFLGQDKAKADQDAIVNQSQDGASRQGG